jgi:hypothetical protein
LKKWGGEAWRKLQVDVDSIGDNEDALLAAAHYREAAKTLDSIISDVSSKEAADQELARGKLIEEQEVARREQQRAAEVTQAAAELAERKAQAEKLAAQEEAEKVKKAAELEKLRNTPLFEGTVSIVTSQFRSFEFGFGFWAESAVGGARLRVFLNGKQPGVLFGGDKADDTINIDNRLKGSQQYSSGGHDFLIEWDKPSKLSWSPKVVVRRLN